MLSSRSLLTPFASLFLSFSRSAVSSLFLFLLPGSLCSSSCRAEVNVQAHGVTEITHTLVANPLDCDSPRLYLASNCSFFFSDARWSTCRSRSRGRAARNDELSRSRVRIHFAESSIAPRRLGAWHFDGFETKRVRMAPAGRDPFFSSKAELRFYG